MSSQVEINESIVVVSTSAKEIPESPECQIVSEKKLLPRTHLIYKSKVYLLGNYSAGFPVLELDVNRTRIANLCYELSKWVKYNFGFLKINTNIFVLKNLVFLN